MPGERTRITLTSLAFVLDCVQLKGGLHFCLHHMHKGTKAVRAKLKEDANLIIMVLLAVSDADNTY